MSMMMSFVLSFFPPDVLDEILHFIESVSEGFLTYSIVYEHLFSMEDYSQKKEPAAYVESFLLQFYLTLLLVIEDVLFCCLRYS